MHYGKYRAKVVDVKDPEFRGRIKVLCPKVYGDFKSPWCLPCSPFALDNKGFLFVPKLNEMIWIEFEEGDSELPIWVGGLWKEKSTPIPESDYNEYIVEKRLIYTESGHQITLCDKDGEKFIHIKDSMGNEIHMDSETGNVKVKALKDLTLEATNNVYVVAGNSIYENASNEIIETAGSKIASNAGQVHHN